MVRTCLVLRRLYVSSTLNLNLFFYPMYLPLKTVNKTCLFSLRQYRLTRSANQFSRRYIRITSLLYCTLVLYLRCTSKHIKTGFYTSVQFFLSQCCTPQAKYCGKIFNFLNITILDLFRALLS